MKGAGHGEFTVGAKGGASDRYAPLKSVKLQLNGLDRFAERQGSYFNAVQPYEHLKTKPASGVYMYNFGLRPDETQPSGSCNLSRIDNATLVVTTKAGSVAYNDAANVTSDDVTLANVAGNLTNLLVFAESFNVLRKKKYARNSRPSGWFKDTPVRINVEKSLGFSWRKLDIIC